MHTKFVYVLVCSDNDIYQEQAFVSIWSLRHYNPDAKVLIVADNKTAERVEKTSELRKMVSEIIAVDFEAGVPNKERSRWLKTNLRTLVDGDFLFLDTDTIITESLSEVDSFDFDLGMVYSWHCKMVERPNKEGIMQRIKTLYGIDIGENTNYFNSGVIFCKDTEHARSFFSTWHKFWKMGKDKPKGIQDQQSLAVAVNEVGGVHALSGIYNCQPIYSIKHLSTAKIVHFFNLKWDDYKRTPFNTDEFYLDIKKNGYISEEKKQLILDCRSTFIAPSMLICGEDINIWSSAIFNMLRKIQRNHKFIYRLLNSLSWRMGGGKSSAF